jgi:hypothetical protein
MNEPRATGHHNHGYMPTVGEIGKIFALVLLRKNAKCIIFQELFGEKLSAVNREFPLWISLCC